MAMGPLVRRLLSPTGFVLVAGCFLLPFATASCGTDTEPIAGTFTGADLVTGHLPTREFVISVSENYRKHGDTPPQDLIERIAASVRPIGWQPLLAAALLFALLGAAAGLMRRPWFRTLFATVAALVAGVLLAAGETVAKSAIYDRIGTDLRAMTNNQPVRSFLTVRTSGGVWLALVLLLVLFLGNAAVLIRSWPRPDARVYPRTLEYPMSEPYPDESPPRPEPDEPPNAGYTTQEYDRERMNATTEERLSDTTG